MLFIAQAVPNLAAIIYGWQNRPTACIGKPQMWATTRDGMWDCARVGAGAAPIKTEEGWLEIYHGADFNHRYCLGALLLDLNDPSKVIARSEEPIMEPIAAYE